jgi:molybdenum cofactor cytidylyltransferase
MKFGPASPADAIGGVTVHTLRQGPLMLKKGTTIGPAEVEALTKAGVKEVVVVRLEDGDVSEDVAAASIAQAVAGEAVNVERAFTGRANLFAGRAGVLVVDRAAVDRINGVDEAITFATLAAFKPVVEGEMIATVKLIPFGVEAKLRDAAVAAATGSGVLRIAPYTIKRVGIVSTLLPGLAPKVIEKTLRVTAERLAPAGAAIIAERRVPHDEDVLAAAIKELLGLGAELVIVFGASAIADRRDVIPAAIGNVGGTIEHFGMPVDPGNLICLGRIGHRPALVLPGCARSPKLNGIDWVLARLFAGLELGGPELARMGVGGLLKDVAARPLPRAKATKPAEAPARDPAPRGKPVAAVVLAAGRSLRMAPHNKLLVPDRTGKPMIARVVDNLLSSAARPIIVVTGHREDDVRAALGKRPVRFVTAAEYAAGLSASLRAGIAAVPADAVAAIICLGDMPLVTGRMIDRLIEAHDADEGRLVVAPTGNGKLGNPVLWDRRFFPEIAALSGDSGARVLLDRHADDLATVELGDAVLRDFDTVESLATLPGHMRPALEPSPTS